MFGRGTPTAGLASGTARSNAVANGGFEDAGPPGSLAAGWSPYHGERAAAQSHIRLDRSNPRSGERALLVRPAVEGARAGAQTTIKLGPGRWELRAWACADVGQKAQVQAQLAGKELPALAIGDDWARLGGVVDVEKPLAGASLRLWSATPQVRVWFDDVEVVPAD